MRTLIVLGEIACLITAALAGFFGAMRFGADLPGCIITGFLVAVLVVLLTNQVEWWTS